MNKKLKVLKNLYSVLSIITVILGLLMIFSNPNMRELILKISGIVIIVYGIIKVFSYFSKDLLRLAYQHDLAIGLIAIILGFLVLFWKLDYKSTIVRLVSVFLIFDSALKVQTAIESKKVGINSWVLLLVLSIIGIVGGICIFTQSFTVSTSAIIFIGICFMTYGIINLLVVYKTSIISKGERNGIEA